MAIAWKAAVNSGISGGRLPDTNRADPHQEPRQRRDALSIYSSATSAIGLLTPRPYLIEVHGLRNIRPKQAPLTLEPNEARPWSR
jgi:hypothetical protein